MIDFSQVTNITLGSTPVEQVTDSQGNVLWSGGFEVFIYAYHGNVSVNGVIGTFQQTVPSGTVLTVQGIPDSGYMFKNWSDGNTDNPRTIIVQNGINLFSDFQVIPNYMYVEDTSGSDNTLTIKKSTSGAPTVTVYKSTDCINWASMGNTSNLGITATVPANGKLYLKATINNWGKNSYYNTIKCSGNHNVGGNIMSLLWGDNFVGKTAFPNTSTQSVFYNLFYNNTNLISAGNLLLPVINLTGYCYTGMFSGCTALTSAPALPATGLNQYCYADMFAGCTSLTTAPSLPSDDCEAYCYSRMFQNCTSLVNPPSSITSSGSASYCYQYMFQNCTSLTTAPVLNFWDTSNNSNAYMFDGCSNLNDITVYMRDISSTNCLQNWLRGVAATGTFRNMWCNVTYPSGDSGIPTGWTEVHSTGNTINVTITNTNNYSGATYQIDSGTVEPINQTGTTSFTVPTTATSLTVNRNGKGTTDILGVCGISSDTAWTTEIPVNKMSNNVSIDLLNLM